MYFRFVCIQASFSKYVYYNIYTYNSVCDCLSMLYTLFIYYFYYLTKKKDFMIRICAYILPINGINMFYVLVINANII